MEKMKKNIVKISLLALLVSFSSCTQDEELAMLDAGGNTVLKDTKISRLDTDSDIKIGVILKAGVSVSKLEIFYNTAASGAIVLGTKIGEATVSGDLATLSSSKLIADPNFVSNQSTDKGTIALAFVTTYSDGSMTTNPYSLTVARGIDWKILDDDGLSVTNATSGTTNINYLDNTTGVNVLRYAVYKKYANTVVDNVTVQWKKNKAGTYSVGVATFPITKGEIDLGNLNYSSYGLAVNDTLYYKISVKSGTQTDYIQTAIAINTQKFGASASAEITDALTANKFSFATGLNYDDADEDTEAEVEFTSPYGLSKTGTTSITFVKSNGTDYDTADLFSAEVDFLAGTAVTILTNLAQDDVIIYKIVRDDVTSYGMIKVGDLSSSTLNSTTTKTFTFEYKEGTILRA
jgi:hypothetical protein